MYLLSGAGGGGGGGRRDLGPNREEVQAHTDSTLQSNTSLRHCLPAFVVPTCQPASLCCTIQTREAIIICCTKHFSVALLHNALLCLHFCFLREDWYPSYVAGMS